MHRLLTMWCLVTNAPQREKYSGIFVSRHLQVQGDMKGSGNEEHHDELALFAKYGLEEEKVAKGGRERYMGSSRRRISFVNATKVSIFSKCSLRADMSWLEAA